MLLFLLKIFAFSVQFYYNINMEIKKVEFDKVSVKDFEQFQDVYGERVFSRLMHKQQSLKIRFNGVDLRVKGAKQIKKK